MTRRTYQSIVVFAGRCALHLALAGCVQAATGAEARSAEPQTVHHFFDFTSDDFALRLTGLPQQALADPETFLSLAADMLQLPEGYLDLVDRSHSIPAERVPNDLVPLSEYPEIISARENLFLDRPAAIALAQLSTAAKADGVTLPVVSAYRTHKYQEELFQYFAGILGAVENARSSAPAGASQHQLGTTIDFDGIFAGFLDTPEGKWLLQNAAAWGWSLSYPEGMEEETGYIEEGWHWRWLGSQTLVMQNAFFNGYQHRLLEFWNNNVHILDKAKRSDEPSSVIHNSRRENIP